MKLGAQKLCLPSLAEQLADDPCGSACDGGRAVGDSAAASSAAAASAVGNAASLGLGPGLGKSVRFQLSERIDAALAKKPCKVWIDGRSRAQAGTEEYIQ